MLNYGSNFRSPRVDVHKFAMVPKADIPRSTFRIQNQHKTTLDAANLYPIYVQEILPGDSFNVQMTAFVRLATPIFPIMDQITLESFFFYVPNRILWNNWVRFQGEQLNPADSISYTVPTCTSSAGGFPSKSIFDYMGIPVAGQISGANTTTVNCLPLRAYNLIWDTWFRDQNLQNATMNSTIGGTAFGDGPDAVGNFNLLKVNKRHDYFTSCLPWPQKGAQGAIPILPNNTSATNPGATVTTVNNSLKSGAQVGTIWHRADTGANPGANLLFGMGATAGFMDIGTNAMTAATGQGLYPANLYADLSTLGGNTIRSLTLAFQTQKLLERDARGGTRYQELLMAHWGVRPPDYRVQRPEYLGGGKSPVNITPVPQTGQTGLTGGSTPMGTLAAVGTAVARGHGFRQSFTEHGYILGLVAFRADQLYQESLRKLWSRSTRYDFYMPVFANLGEQAVLNQELYCQGISNDTQVFGYQARWEEYRYMPSLTTAFFNSHSATPLDAWHLANKFTSLPTLNSTYIQEPLGTILQRVVAAGASGLNQMFLCDFFFDQKCARLMPMYSVPGLTDHF